MKTCMGSGLSLRGHSLPAPVFRITAQIQARRAANGQAAYSGPTDAVSTLAEFETQRGLEFYLENKRLGDLVRNGAAVKFAPVPGSTYFKAGFAPVGSQTCIPLPITETDNNPNFKP